MQRFRVVITETVSYTHIVVASDPAEAERLADELCESGEVTEGYVDLTVTEREVDRVESCGTAEGTPS